MKKIKKGDEIIVIAGKDKGKKGTVLSIVADGEKVLIDGINLVKKHIKANPNTGEQGGIKPIAKPVHRSNVMLCDPTTQKASKVGVRVLEDGQRVRFYKGSDQLVDVK